MRKKILALTIIALSVCLFSCNCGEKKSQQIVDIPNSSTSVDWAGTYTGTLPCADCEGITTVITLFENSTYKMMMTYLGKDFEIDTEGYFSWNDEGSIIKLDTEGEGMNMFKVGENMIMMLDINGEKITGQLANNYILIKE